MKKLLFIFVMLVGSLQAYSQAAKLIASQAKPAQTVNAKNLLYVDTTDMRIWAVDKNAIMINPQQVTWLDDSVVVITSRKFVRKDTIYNNPAFIGSYDYNKLINKPSIPSSQVNSDWNSSSGVSQILNKPVLSSYMLTSTANSTFYPLTNPNGFISSYTEADPIWNGDKPSYRTKVQNDALYQPVGSYLTSESDPTVSVYAKSLTAFSVIKSSTDPLYRPIGYVPDTAVYRTTANSLTLVQEQTKFNAKQNTLVSGTNIKTVGGTTLLGAGDIPFPSYTTTQVSEGTNLYFTQARVLSSPLTGYATGTNTPIVATNTVLNGMQNLQAQITAINSNMIVNTATVGLSKATLNSTYPNVGFGYMVFCPSIILGGAIYIKNNNLTGTSGTWQTISAPPTL